MYLISTGCHTIDVQAHADGSTELEIRVDDLGGIDTAEFRFRPGVTILAGRNATNRTSLLNAVAGALGGSGVTVRGGADAGAVTLAFQGETYERQYRRRGGETVAVDGVPYVDDTALVDTFARLLRDNPIRRAVREGADLRDLLMEPVDTSAIEAAIDELRQERDEIRSRLDEIERERERLPRFEQRRDTLATELDELAAERDELTELVADTDLDRDAAESADELLTELDEQRQRLSELRDRVDTQQASIEALEEDREEIQTELAAMAPVDEDASTADRLDELRRRAQDLSEAINDLSAIVEFNEGLLDGDRPSDLSQDDTPVPTALDPDSTTIQCWTCGSEVQRATIDGRLDELRSVVQDKRAERRSVQDEIDQLEAEREKQREQQARRSELESRLADIDDEIDRRKAKIADFKNKIGELRNSIRAIEEDLEEPDALGEAAKALLDQYQRLSEIEYDRGQVDQELTDVRKEIKRIEGLADERDDLEARLADLEDELTDLRTRVEARERAVVETFNDHMETLVDLLHYDNVERIWIERRVQTDGIERTFDLHIVRQTLEGAAYEDSLQTLSESESEIVGLVAALAGYLAHDVHETVPILLLDSLEAIDADRIATLVEYLADVVPYLFVALLAEDAQAIPDSYPQLSF